MLKGAHPRFSWKAARSSRNSSSSSIIFLGGEAMMGWIIGRVWGRKCRGDQYSSRGVTTSRIERSEKRRGRSEQAREKRAGAEGVVGVGVLTYGVVSGNDLLRLTCTICIADQRRTTSDERGTASLPFFHAMARGSMDMIQVAASPCPCWSDQLGLSPSEQTNILRIGDSLKLLHPSTTTTILLTCTEHPNTISHLHSLLHSNSNH